ncbi:MAG: sigma-70 family RNA polymerase sigma factor [Pseudomonadota bacterium]|nr:sigma-70 family RNA polymerase sigma factor [Pseudomonadota bacterium]
MASYAPPGQDREDLSQEVALSIVQALARFRGESSVKTYVLRIAHNVGLRHAMRRRQLPEGGLDDVPDDRRDAAAPRQGPPEVVVGGRMTPDPDLAALATTWKEDDMTSLHLTFTPAKLAHTNRWEGRLTLVFAVIIGGFAATAAGSGLLGHDPALVVLGVLLTVFALLLGRASRGLRARARVADTLLEGPPIDVARGHRHLVHTRLCAIRSPTAIGITFAPFLLYAALVAYGAIPAMIALFTVTGFAGLLAWVHLHTVPALRAEVARLDALIEELGAD